MPELPSYRTINQVPALNMYQIVWTKSIKISADTYLNINAEKIEEDELKSSPPTLKDNFNLARHQVGAGWPPSNL